MLDARGDERVEAIHRGRIGPGVVHPRAVRAAEQRALVVVEADRVVAHSREVGGEAVGRLARGGRVRVAAEVHAVEALRLAGQALELEVAADGDDAPELAGGRVVRDDARKVERGAGLDPDRAFEGDPVGPRLERDGVAFAQDERTVGGRADGRAHLVAAPALHRALGEEEAQRERRAVPVAAVLQEDAGRGVECDAAALRAVAVEEREVRDGAAEEVGLGPDLDRDLERAAVEERGAAAEAGEGDGPGDEELREGGVGRGRGGPFGADGAVAGFGEARAAVDARGAGGVRRPHREAMPAVGVIARNARGAVARPAGLVEHRREGGDRGGEPAVERDRRGGDLHGGAELGEGDVRRGLRGRRGDRAEGGKERQGGLHEGSMVWMVGMV